MSGQYWTGFLKVAQHMPRKALGRETVTAGISTALCARVLLGCCRTQHDSPADTRRRLAADLAAGHVGERMYRHASEALDALERAWRSRNAYVPCGEDDWIAMHDGSGGHMRRNHLGAHTYER